MGYQAPAPRPAPAPAPLATPHKRDAVFLNHPTAGAVTLILDDDQRADSIARRLNDWLEKVIAHAVASATAVRPD